MPKVGELVLVRLPNEDEIESRIKSVSGDQVEIEWPQSVDEGGWVTNVGMMSRNAEGVWVTDLPARGDGIHPANRPRKGA